MIIHSPVVTGSLQLSGSFLPQQALTASYVDLVNVDGSASLASRISAQESFSSSLNSTFATDGELSAVSSSLASRVAQNASAISNISTDFADIQNKPTLVSQSAQVVISDTAGYSTFSSSLATNIATNKTASFANLITIGQVSQSLQGRIGQLEGDIDLKAPLASPSFTGNPTAPTQTGSDSSTKLATTAFVQGRLDNLIGNAGAALDTLGELSASLASDQSALTSLTNTVGGKLQKDQNLSDLTDAAAARTNLGVDAAGTDNSTDVTLAGAYDYLTLSGQQITLGQIDWSTDIANKPSLFDGDYNNLSNKPAVISSSDQVTLSDTTGYSTFSSSLATNIAANKTASFANLITIGYVSSSLASRVGDLEAAPSAGDGTITLTAGTGLSGGGSFTTNQSSNSTVTFNASDVYNRFQNIAVSGNTTIVADGTNDTLTLQNGVGISLASNHLTDTVVISHGNTSDLSGTYGGPNLVTQNIDRPSSIVVDSNGHVTGIQTSPIAGFAEGGIAVSVIPPTGYDFGIEIVPSELQYKFVSPNSSISIGHDTNSDRITLTAAPPSLVGGTNINIGTNNVINLDNNVTISGDYQVTVAGSGGDRINAILDETGIKFKRKPQDTQVPFLLDYLRLGDSSFDVFQQHTSWMFNGYNIKAGVSDYTTDAYNDEETVLSKIHLGNYPTVSAGYFHGGLNFYGMRNTVVVTPGAGDISEFLFGYNPVGANGSFSLGGLYVKAGNDGVPNGLLQAGGYSCGDGNYGGGFTAMPDASVDEWWTIVTDYNAGAGRFYLNGSDQGLLGSSPSDYRVKQNINQISEGAIDRVKQLKPVAFNWKTTDKFGWKNEEITKEGFIAHEVQEVIPSGATGEKDGDNIQQLELDSIVAVLTKAVQEQQAMIETLQSEIEILKAK